MPKVTFLPEQKSVEVDDKTKLLLAGKKAGVTIRFACASCRCGTCGVAVVAGHQALSAMKDDELKMLKRLKLPLDGSIRLSCQARIQGDCSIDLDFQNQYDTPDDFEDQDDES